MVPACTFELYGERALAGVAAGDVEGSAAQDGDVGGAVVAAVARGVLPCFSFRKRLRNLSFVRPNSAISLQLVAPHSTATNAIARISTRSWRVLSARGSGTLSN